MQQGFMICELSRHGAWRSLFNAGPHGLAEDGNPSRLPQGDAPRRSFYS